MNLEEIRQFCLQLPGTTEDVKWDNRLCFSIAEKMYLIVGLDDLPTTTTFKTAPEHFSELTRKEPYKPAPYLARGKWVTITDVEMLPPETMKEHVTGSYSIIKSKLSKKLQKEIENHV